MKRFAAIAIIVLVGGAVTAPLVWMVFCPWGAPDQPPAPSAPSREVTTEALVRQLRHEHFLIRQAAASTLRARGWEPRDDTERAWLLVALRQWKDAAELGPAAVEPFAVALADPEPTIHNEAIAALGRARSEDAARILGETLCRGPEHLRDLAAWELGISPSPKAVDVLIAALPDLPPDSHLLSTAHAALGRHRDPRVIPILAKALASQGQMVRQDAVLVLGGTHDTAAVPHLDRALGDPESGVRLAAAGSLRQILHTDAIPMLVEAVRQGRLHDSEFVTVMVGFGPRAIPALTGALGSSSPEVRVVAADALGHMGDRRVVPLLTRALEDENGRVRDAARQALDRVRSVLEAKEGENSE